MTASISGLRSVHLGVEDPSSIADFFTGSWGLSVVERAEAAVYLRATGSDCYVIALHKRPRTEVLRLDFRAPTVTAADAIRTRLSALDVRGLTAAARTAEFGKGYAFSMRDPDGRLLFIVADDDRHALSADAIDLPRKLSHVVVNTPDATRLEDFYIRGLGGRLVDRTRRMAFINCNSDHHSLAIVPSDDTTLNHIAFEMPSFDALMRGVGRLRDAGLEIGWGIGRHGPGRNIFSYFVGPENLPLEYTTEVQQIDESYKVGAPDDWKPVPGRRDLWGAAPPPSPAMETAERSIEFSRDIV